MGDATTRADVKGDAGTTTPSPTTRDWKALARRVWPLAAMILAAVLWWPVGFTGRADWMHLPFMQAVGGVAPIGGAELFFGALVAAAAVSALVSSAWPKFGIAAGLTAIAWVLSEGDVTFAANERPVLAALIGLGMLLGLGVGARAPRGPIAVASFLALVSGLSPASYSRGLILAVAVALPFWAATADRVAPTILAVVRVVVTWLAAVLVFTGLSVGFSKLKVGALAHPADAAPVVGRGFVDFLKDHGVETVKAAPQTYTSWFWVAVVLAIAFVVAANVVRRQRSKAN